MANVTRWGRSLCVAAVGVLVSIYFMPTSASGAGSTAPTAWGTCTGTASAKVNYGPNKPLTPRKIEFSFTAHYVCVTSDPTIHSAVETGGSTGEFNCATLQGYERGVDTFTWSNGRTSQLAYYDKITAALSQVEGTFTQGEFAGARVSFPGIAVGNLLSFCLSPAEGELDLVYAGVGHFEKYA